VAEWVIVFLKRRCGRTPGEGGARDAVTARHVIAHVGYRSGLAAGGGAILARACLSVYRKQYR
jgi:hypothetical protein